MKKLVYIVLFLPFIIMAQTTSENYVKSTSYKVKTLDGTTKAVGGSVANEEKQVSVSYFDGLGRLKQNVAIRAGGQSQDIVSHTEFDEFGRQVKDYLPYATAGNGGLFRTGNLATETNQFYQTKYPDDFLNTSESNVNAYSEKVFDGSPLNRVMEQAAPGKDWKVGNGHTIQFEYDTNTEREVLNFEVNFSGGDSARPTLPLTDRYYEPNELYKTVTKDENWKTAEKKDRTTEEYKNKQGQILLKRTYNSQDPHDTYYVYDDFGNLTYVLPPLASDKTIVYETGMQSYSASTFVTGGSATGTVKFGIEKIGPGQYGYVAEFDLDNLANSDFKSGEIMDLPFMYSSMSNFWLGSVSVSNRSENGSYVYKYVSFSAVDGKLMCNSYGYNPNNIPLEFSSFDRRRTTNYPKNLQGFTEVETQEKLEELLEKLCYQYKYDDRNRLIEKKIPGKGWESIVYDKLDRPIMTSDANLASHSKYLITKYDSFGRLAYSGVVQHSSYFPSRSMHQASVSDSYPQFETRRNSANTIGNTSMHYTNEAYPKNNISEIHTINYYDTYTDLPTGLGTTITTAYQVPSTTNTKGLPTVSKVKVLGTNSWITTVSYYDDKARPIYSYSKNEYLNTIDIIESKLDFTGKVLETKTTHKKTGQTDIVTVDKLDYDHADRLLTQKQTINSQPEELIVKNNYDELGQLVKKEVGNTEASPLQEVDYSYNIRGWLKKINDPFVGLGTDLFSFKLLYNEQGSFWNTKLYNGNISQAEWKTANDNTSRYYKYYYDDLNRIRGASYFASNQNSRFNMGSISYDKNGNLQRLYRRGAIVENPDIKVASHYGTMDDLTYTYDGNQLLNVNDTGNVDYGFKNGSNEGHASDYDYDINGNMTQDHNKGVSTITYNHLNLPTQVTINGKTINYIYDATGVKLEKSIKELDTPLTITQYAGNYIYKVEWKNRGSQFELQFFNTPEGYASPNNMGKFDYIYQHKDHLGNVRLSYTDQTKSYQNILDNSFTASFDGWLPNGSVNYSLESGRLKASVNNSWEGVKHYLNGYTTTAGEVLNVKITFDKGNTQSAVRLYLNETDANGNHVAYNVKSSNLQKGTSEFSHTMLNTGNSITFRIDKDNTNTSSETYFYIDHVSLTQGALEIVEESNYYPFGLKHKGYNNVISSNGNSTAQKMGFGGKELQDELGLEWYDVSARNYDPALGRWMNLDPLAEKMRRHSPYNFGFDNPVYFQDYDGMAPTGSCCGPYGPLQNYIIGKLVKYKSGASKVVSGGKKLVTHSIDNSIVDSGAPVGVERHETIGSISREAIKDLGEGSREIIQTTGEILEDTGNVVEMAGEGTEILGEATGVPPLIAAGKGMQVAGIGMQAGGMAMKGESTNSIVGHIAKKALTNTVANKLKSATAVVRSGTTGGEPFVDELILGQTTKLIGPVLDKIEEKVLKKNK